MENLQVLHIHDVNCTWFERFPPQLNTVRELELERLDILQAQLRPLLERMPELKRFSITHCRFISISIFHEVLLLKLEDLEFQLNRVEAPDVIEDEIKVLSVYMKLKSLKMHCGRAKIISLFNAFQEADVQFEYLELSFGLMTFNLAEIISKQRQLKILKLHIMIECDAGQILYSMPSELEGNKFWDNNFVDSLE